MQSQAGWEPISEGPARTEHHLQRLETNPKFYFHRVHRPRGMGMRYTTTPTSSSSPRWLSVMTAPLSPKAWQWQVGTGGTGSPPPTLAGKKSPFPALQIIFFLKSLGVEWRWKYSIGMETAGGFVARGGGGKRSWQAVSTWLTKAYLCKYKYWGEIPGSTPTTTPLPTENKEQQHETPSVRS